MSFVKICNIDYGTRLWDSFRRLPSLVWLCQWMSYENDRFRDTSPSGENDTKEELKKFGFDNCVFSALFSTT